MLWSPLLTWTAPIRGGFHLNLSKVIWVLYSTKPENLTHVHAFNLSTIVDTEDQQRIQNECIISSVRILQSSSFFVLWCWVSLLRRVLWMTRPYVQDLVMWVLISVLLWSLNTNLVHWVSDSIVDHCCQEYVNLRNELTTITLLCLKQTEMTLLVGQLQQRQFQLPLLGGFVVYVMLNAVDWVGIGMPWISAACFCWKNTFTLWRIKENHW